MRRQEGKKRRGKELGSKHFGRSIRAMRLSMALSQGELAAGAEVSFVELSAPFGHDSFLLEVPALDRASA